MIRCPVCDSIRVVVVVSPDPHAFCARCGSVWIQDGDEQRSVVTGEPPVHRDVGAADSGPLPWASV